MSNRHIGPIAAAAAVIALALVAASAPGAATRPAGTATGFATVTFTDPAGDAGVAPDVTTVTLSDVGPGSFQIAVTLGATLQPYQTVDVYLDTDKNSSTGSRSGCEYLVSAWTEADGQRYWDVERWTGSDWASVPETSTMSFSRSGGLYTWRLGAADIGGSGGFAFYVSAYTEDASGNLTAVDYAPDGGSWQFDLASKTVAVVVKPVIAAPTTTPAKPVAGHLFNVRFRVTRSDNGATLTTGTMICDPSVAGRVIPHSEQFANGTARLSFVIPPSAKGKTLRVKVTIKSGGQSATKIVNFRVR